MEFGAGTFAFGFAAGALSTLSPCVVPLLPILVASAVSEHRFGLWALAAGLALSFASLGLLLATIGFAVGLDAALLHRLAGALLVFFGAVLALPALQRAFSRATAGVAGSGSAVLARLSGGGWTGQLLVGLLLGIVWTPCVGPTLGAASTLAAQRSQLGQVAALMLVFGLGAATPLLVLGSLSQRLARRAGRTGVGFGETARRVLGACLLVIGLVIVAGADKSIETWLLDRSPAWLTELTTRF